MLVLTWCIFTEHGLLLLLMPCGKITINCIFHHHNWSDLWHTFWLIKFAQIKRFNFTYCRAVFAYDYISRRLLSLMSNNYYIILLLFHPMMVYFSIGSLSLVSTVLMASMHLFNRLSHWLFSVSDCLSHIDIVHCIWDTLKGLVWIDKFTRCFLKLLLTMAELLVTARVWWLLDRVVLRGRCMCFREWILDWW